MTMPVIADRAAAVLADFCCGANQLTLIIPHQLGHDCPEPLVFDLRLAQEGDASRWTWHNLRLYAELKLVIFSSWVIRTTKNVRHCS